MHFASFADALVYFYGYYYMVTGLDIHPYSTRRHWHTYRNADGMGLTGAWSYRTTRGYAKSPIANSRIGQLPDVVASYYVGYSQWLTVQEGQHPLT